ncbi:MAG: DUF4097 domain-containing protein [Gemmatimonadaceae bacterium]|jgi:hypothetical protein|nr:DUF4097 domain-containing protein [Gemmatimonadaceae bacterium]
MTHAVLRRRFVGALLLTGATATPTLAQRQTETTVTVERNATVEVSGSSNNITVSAGGDGQVRVRGDDVQRLGIRREARSVIISSSGSRGMSTQDIDVVVPRGTVVLLRTNSGDIAVRGTGADVEASTIAGDVSVDEAERVRIETVSGDVQVRRARDGVRVSATSGDVTLSDVAGDVDVSGTSSTIGLRSVTSRRVGVKTVSGDVLWSGPFVSDGRYEFNAHSGDLRFELPRDTRATLDVRTYNGDLTTGSLPITLVPDGTSADRSRSDAERAQLEADRAQLRSVRDSVKRVLSDSMRRERETDRSRLSTSWERDLERSVERLVEGVMRSVTASMESFAFTFDGAEKRGEARRFLIGREGGARVSVSTFNGNIALRGATDSPSRRD